MNQYQTDSDVGNIALEVFLPFQPHGPTKTQKIKKAKSQAIQTQKNLPADNLNIKQKIYHKNMVKSSNLQGAFDNAHNLIQKQIIATVRSVLKSNYYSLLNQYEGTDKHFRDPDFPPTGSSIGGRWANHNNWKRVSQILPNATFVSQKISPADILQGEIGDCYFLSALAALAQHDYRIKNIFPSLQIQKNGIYMARILHRGVLQQVVVDDYIPVNAKNQPLFAKVSAGSSIWVIILEKCWAKLHKSYAVISGGLPHEVLHAFSGAPTLYNSMPKTNDQKQKIFDLLYEADQNNAVLCCGTKFDPEMEKKGLVVGHAYTLLEVYKQPCRMIKIRNPWGQREWNGRANQKDTQFWSKISTQDKEKLKVTDKNDGIFFMLWQDFTQVFNMVDICLIDDKASYLCCDNKYEREKGQMFQLILDNQEKVVISISQDNIRTFKTDVQKKRGYAKTNVILAKFHEDKNGYEYSFVRASQYHLLPDHYLTFDNLQPGQYYIFVECDWLQQASKPATLAVYSTAKISLRANKDIDSETFLYKVFMDHARRNTKKRQVLNAQPYEWMCSQFLLDKCGYGYVAYHINQKSQTKLGIQFDQRQYQKKYIKIFKPYSGNGKIKTIVLPGQELIILFKINPYYNSPSFNFPLPKVRKLLKNNE